MANSTVWLYQRVAQRIGAQRMRERVRALEYGNADIGPDADIAHFWLDGALRISAIEQVTFLERLSRRALPMSERSQSRVADIMTIDGNCGSTISYRAGPSWTLRGKTGAMFQTDPESGELLVSLTPSDDQSDGTEAVGWFVGWMDRDEKVTGVFAFNVRLTSMDQLPMRESLTRQLLVDNWLQVPLTAQGYQCLE
jgi:beta-lactamase class D